MVAIGLAVTGMVVATWQPASATNDTSVRVPDGTPVYLYRNALTTPFWHEAEWVRANGINPTHMTSLYASSVGSTYINIVDNDYGTTGWAGLYDCATGSNSGRCARGDVLIDLYPPVRSWRLVQYN